jgi:hypothetical protein
LIDQAAKNISRDKTIILNSGNNFDIKPSDNPDAPRYILKALDEIGTEAIGVGPEELRFGAEELKNINSQTAIPLVSANIRGFQSYALLSKNQGQTKILVTSVVDPELLLTKGVAINQIIEPAAALREIAQSVDHDMLIVIVHADGQKIPSLVKKCPGIDLVVDGESDTVTKHDAVDDLPIVSNNRQGEYVSYLDFYINQANEYYSKNAVDLKARVGRVAEDPVIKSLITDYNKETNEYYAKLDANIDSGVMKDRNQTQFAGSQSCRQCHPEIGETWSNSRHARALESLKKKSKEYDPDCLSCHTTGFGDPNTSGDSFSMDRTQLMTGVECESCHGPGKQHVQTPNDINMPPVTKAICKQCHTSEKDPDFDMANHKWQVQRSGCNLFTD